MFVQRTFTVPTPAGAVFAYLADFTHTEEWDPGTVTTTLTSGDGGVGTTYHNTSTFLNRQVELDYETVEHSAPGAAPGSAPGRLVFRGHDGKSTWATDNLTLSATEGGAATEIHYRADFVFGFWVNLVAPVVVKPRVEKIADDTILRMYDVLAALPH